MPNRDPDDRSIEARVERARLEVLREEAERRRLREAASRPYDARRAKGASITTAHVLLLLVVILLALVVLKMSRGAIELGCGCSRRAAPIELGVDQRAASALMA